jgi:hypothetical protein
VFRIRIGSGFNQVSGFVSGSGSRRAKNDPKTLEISFFGSAGCFLLRAEDFFRSLEILHGGLEIGKFKIVLFDKKKLIFFSAVNFFQFLVIKPLDPVWIRIRIK